MNIGAEYIKYLWKAKKRHGIHSPFVYDLTDKCLSAPIDQSDVNVVESIENALKKNYKSIEIEDFGAGSKKLGKTRKISDIYQNSSSKGKYGKLLYQLTAHYKPNQTLELGTSLGIGTIQLALGYKEGMITTIEACQNTQAIAIENFSRTELNNINSIRNTFDNFLNELNTDVRFDLVFIDGHHDGSALLHYLDKLKPFIHNDTLILLDDIRWSKSMFDAWHQITNDPNYHVTIDFFRMGMIAPRPQQVKEHFTIRL